MDPYCVTYLPENAVPVIDSDLADGLATRRTSEAGLVRLDRETLDIVTGWVILTAMKEWIESLLNALSDIVDPPERALSERYGSAGVQIAEFGGISDEVLGLVVTAWEPDCQTVPVPLAVGDVGGVAVS